MSLITCKNCKNRFDSNSKYCPQCLNKIQPNPWYKRWWAIAIGALLLIGVVLPKDKNGRVDNSEDVTVSNAQRVKDSIDVANVNNFDGKRSNPGSTTGKGASSGDLMITQYISELKSKKTLVDNYSVEGIISAVQKIKDQQLFVTNSLTSSDPKEAKLAKEYKALLIKAQLNDYPKLRKGFISNLKDKLWRENVYVVNKGKNSTKVSFEGGTFASNANIEDFYTTIRSMLEDLRFKQIQFRWYKDADEFTYYTIESPSDSRIEP